MPPCRRDQSERSSLPLGHSRQLQPHQHSRNWKWWACCETQAQGPMNRWSNKTTAGGKENTLRFLGINNKEGVWGVIKASSPWRLTVTSRHPPCAAEHLKTGTVNSSHSSGLPLYNFLGWGELWDLLPISKISISFEFLPYHPHHPHRHFSAVPSLDECSGGQDGRCRADRQSHLGFWSGFQEAQTISKSLGCQAELPLLLVNVGDALEDHFIFLPGEQRPMWGARDYLPMHSQAPKAPAASSSGSLRGTYLWTLDKGELVPLMAYLSSSPESGFYSTLGSGVARAWNRGTT